MRFGWRDIVFLVVALGGAGTLAAGLLRPLERASTISLNPRRAASSRMWSSNSVGPFGRRNDAERSAASRSFRST